MKNNVNLKQTVPAKLTSILEKAADFHGHLGPFLVIGIRIGLVGLSKMSRHDGDKLTIELSLPLHVPFSCIIDGVQFTTHCTIGNQKLSLKDANSVKARFKRESDKMEVTVAINKSMFEELRSQLLGMDILSEKVRKLAWMVATIPEDELFKIS